MPVSFQYCNSSLQLVLGTSMLSSGMGGRKMEQFWLTKSKEFPLAAKLGVFFFVSVVIQLSIHCEWLICLEFSLPHAGGFAAVCLGV